MSEHKEVLKMKDNKEKPLSVSTGMDMTNGPMLGKILAFALPLAGGSVLQQLFNAVDVAVVGRFASSSALAGVGANSSVVSLFVTLFVGISVGANVVIANNIGRNSLDRISDAVHTSVLFGLLSGFGLMFLGLAVARPLLELLGTPEDVMDLAVLYLRIYMFGMPFIMLYNFGSAVLRSMGDTRRPLYSLIVAGVVNAVLNVIFVVGFHRSVDGVAAATVISNVLSAGMIIWFLLHEEEPVRLHPSRLKMHRDILGKTLRIGVPAGLQGMVFSISNVVIQSGINRYGAAAIAGVSVALNCDIFAYFTVSGFAQAAVTFTAQNFGAGKLDRCRNVFHITMACGIVVSLLYTAVLIPLRYQLVGIFTEDPAVMDFATRRIVIIMLPYVLVNTYEITGSCLRGLNHSMTPALLTIIGTCVLRIFWVRIVDPLVNDFAVLMYVYPVSWILTGAMVLAAYFIIRGRVEKEFQEWDVNDPAAA